MNPPCPRLPTTSRAGAWRSQAATSASRGSPSTSFVLDPGDRGGDVGAGVLEHRAGSVGACRGVRVARMHEHQTGGERACDRLGELQRAARCGGAVDAHHHRARTRRRRRPPRARRRSPPRAGRETGPAMTRCPAALRVRDRRRELRPSPHTRRSRWRLRSARRPPTPRPPGNRWRPQGARTRGGCRAGASNSLLSAANWSVAAKSTSAEGAPAGDTLTCTSVVAQPALRVSHKANAGRVGATRAVIADYQSREAIGHPDRVIVIEHRSRGACIGPVQSGEHA